MKVPRETYTIPARPADPPPQERMVPSIPMPSGYRQTIPIGGWYTPLPRPDPTSVPLGGVVREDPGGPWTSVFWVAAALFVAYVVAVAVSP